MENNRFLMPKGEKKQKIKKRKVVNTGESIEKQLILKSEMEEYGLVTKLCGDCKVMVEMPSGTQVMARIPGKMRRNKCPIKVGTIVLISKREYQSTMVDIIVVYGLQEVRKLYAANEIPANFIGGGEEDRQDGMILIDDKADNAVSPQNTKDEESDNSLSDL